MVFIVTTSFVAIFVREKDVDSSEQDEGFVVCTSTVDISILVILNSIRYNNLFS